MRTVIVYGVSARGVCLPMFHFPNSAAAHVHLGDLGLTESHPGTGIYNLFRGEPLQAALRKHETGSHRTSLIYITLGWNNSGKKRVH